MAEQTKGNTPAGDPAEQPGGFDLTSFMEKVAQASFEVDFWKDPETALNSYKITLDGIDLKKQMISVWKASLQNAIIEVVSERTGADPEQLRDPERRTPEQQREMLQAMQEADERRAEQYKKSAYSQALSILDELQGNYHSAHDGDPNYIGIKEQTCLYFFTLHDEIPRFGQAPLTDEQKAELIETFYRLDNMYANEADRYKDDESSEPTLFYKFIEAAQQDNTPAEIQRLTSIIPLSHVMANNSLMNTLTSLNAVNAGAFDMPVINKTGKRQEITAYTIASYDQDKDGAGELIKSKLTEYERQVSDAVISIWEQARKSGLPPEFTTDMVFRAMPGSGDKPSPQQAGAITRTIEKLRNLHIYLDVTEEMRVRGLISDKETAVFDDKFLSAGRVTRKIKNGGQTVIAYHLHTEPLVLSYCKMTNQLITVSPKWLEVKKVKGGKAAKENMAMTQERQAITGYLIRRIAIMKNDKRNKKPTQSDTILFATIFNDIGVPEPDKFKAADIRNFCFEVLDYYKAEKLIAGYEKQTKGRSITGIIIKL